MSKREPWKFAAPAENGPQYFRTLEAAVKSGDPEFKRELAMEFSRAHTHTPASDEAVALGRRGFMTMMGAALALAGAEGCRRPLERIVPYQRVPEQVIPGIPTHFATVYDRRGESLGLLVESHEGRPTKVEGNPDHPSSLGAADLVAQASILDLYDMDRSRAPRRAGSDADATWAAFDADLGKALTAHEADQGAKLRVLMQPTTSPTVLRLRRAVQRRFPKAVFHTYSAVSASNVREGVKLAFGQYAQPIYNYDQANVILALDCDFLQTEPGNVRATKLFTAKRRLRSVRDTMSRLYVVEPMWTTTGTNADHRLRLPAADVEKYLLALVAHLMASSPELFGQALADLADAAKAAVAALGPSVPTKWFSAVANDLTLRESVGGNIGKSIIVVGSRQPPAVHAVAFALNQALGNLGKTVDFVAVTDPEEQDNVADVKALADAMNASQVDTLVMLGGNPVYDAPSDVRFAEGLTRLKLSVHLAQSVDETGEKCTWHIPRAHEYEAWGDARSMDGSFAVQQPLIAPLFGGRSDIELLAAIAKAPEQTGYDAVRATWIGGDGMMLASEGMGYTQCEPKRPGWLDCFDGKERTDLALASLDKRWTRLLRNGVLVDPNARADATTRSSDIVWPPRDKRRLAGLGIKTPAIKAALGARTLTPSPTKDSLEVVFAPCPKMLDGRYANNSWLLELPDPMTKLVWDNAAILSPATAQARGLVNGDVVTISVPGASPIDVGVWVLHGQADNTIALTLGWGRTRAGRLGNGKGFNVNPARTTKAMHFAAAATVTKNSAKTPYPFGQTQTYDYQYTDVPHPEPEQPRAIARETTYSDYRESPNFADLQAPPPRKLPLWGGQDYSQGYQWGMTIDLTACTGCNACTIACQAENNVPVVGKIEAARGREMYWLRIDRYFVTYTPHEGQGQHATMEDPLVAHQPLACVQCEDAPCENVCPVNATTHSAEGLNDMAYNRCIGTRYCANNCPYKVRRFNYLNWHNDAVWKNDGDIPETYKMQMNPNVTVRFRGVMEKCTYCVQRIQMAKIKVKREKSSNPARELRDGEIVTACQQTCPADAIVFGNLNDPRSQVSVLTALDRQYKLLDELGTKPRTTYLGKVRNPNREMA